MGHHTDEQATTDRTKELKELFVTTTGTDTVTEEQETSEKRCLSAGGIDEHGVERTIAESGGLSFPVNYGVVVRVVRLFFDGHNDEAIAERLGRYGVAEVVPIRYDLGLTRTEDPREGFEDLYESLTVDAQNANATDLHKQLRRYYDANETVSEDIRDVTHNDDIADAVSGAEVGTPD